jgi:hypothetical protein
MPTWYGPRSAYWAIPDAMAGYSFSSFCFDLAPKNKMSNGTSKSTVIFSFFLSAISFSFFDASRFDYPSYSIVLLVSYHFFVGKYHFSILTPLQKG